MNRLLTLLFALGLLAGPTFGQTADNPSDPAPAEYTFRFVAGDDMFYIPWSGNGEELDRLLACIAQNKAAITEGSVPVLVDGYCTSQPSEAENLALAKTRSNRVKTEMILRGGLTEACFRTQNHADKGNFVTVCLVIPATPLRRRPSLQPAALPRRPSALKPRNAPKRSALPLNGPPRSSARPKRHAGPPTKPRRSRPYWRRPMTKSPKAALWASPCVPTCCAGLP